jgi:hypothetical protein
VANVDTFNNSNRFHVETHSLYPIKMCSSALLKDDDDATVITLNVSSNIREPKSYKLRAIDHIVKNDIACAAFHLNTTDAIADSGATQIFVMDSTTVVNKHKTMHPLKVALANGRIVLSTHMCDIKIEGLPTVLTGHIILDLLIASLFGIRVLTDAGCTVTFDKNRCIV